VRSPEGLARRVLTASALLGAFLATLLLLDPRVFAVLVALVLALAAYEWAQLAGLGRGAAGACAATFAGLFVALAWTGAARGAALDWLLATAAGFWMLLAPLWLRFGIGGAPRALLLAAGAALLAVAGLAAVSLPPKLLLLVLGLVWIADTAAFFAGNAFGRRQLAPSISPGKTWEGVAGAIVAALVYAVLFALPGAPLSGHVTGPGWVPYLAAVVLLCAVSILGDLFESALKRRAGVKDSGSLLPGHGGVLDRLDSMLSTLPVAAGLLHWAGKA
jgi:phosphatidate cytidylyltransferase